jgi:hypothetical protein
VLPGAFQRPQLPAVARARAINLSISGVRRADSDVDYDVTRGRVQLAYLRLGWGSAELGVRMALGADRSAVRWLIMREALGLVLLGLVVGLPLALLCARALRSTLYGVSSLDLPAYAAAAVVLISIATLAGYLPARRASRLDPVTALRAD